MSETAEWRDLRESALRRWWIPLLLAVVGAALGVYAASNLDPVYRSQGTLLVGPLDSTVTRSTTLRASESLAIFYADVARREVVLVPVREQLGLSMSLDDLRSSVSAVVPDQNPRVVTVTVEGDSRAEARTIAVAVVRELVTLSPAPAGVTAPAFVTQQSDALETTIQQTEEGIDTLRAELAQATDSAQRSGLERTIAVKEQYLNDSRQTYVALVSLEPDSDAGGLAVLDDVTSVTDAGRAGTTTGALLGAAMGGVLGLAVARLLDRRRRARRRQPAAPAREPAAETPSPPVGPATRTPNRALPRSSPRRTEPRRVTPRERVNR